MHISIYIDTNETKRAVESCRHFCEVDLPDGRIRVERIPHHSAHMSNHGNAVDFFLHTHM